MVTFFTILLILVVLNLALLLFSSVASAQKVSQLTKKISQASQANIDPLEWITSKYKKAI